MSIPASGRGAVRIGLLKVALAALLAILLALAAVGSAVAAIGNTATTTFRYSIVFNPPTTTATNSTVLPHGSSAASTVRSSSTRPLPLRSAMPR
jgi:hypothetical protein